MRILIFINKFMYYIVYRYSILSISNTHIELKWKKHTHYYVMNQIVNSLKKILYLHL